MGLEGPPDNPDEFTPHEIADICVSFLSEEEYAAITEEPTEWDALALLFVVIEEKRGNGELSARIDEILESSGLGVVTQYFG